MRRALAAILIALLAAPGSIAGHDAFRTLSGIPTPRLFTTTIITTITTITIIATIISGETPSRHRSASRAPPPRTPDRDRLPPTLPPTRSGRELGGPHIRVPGLRSQLPCDRLRFHPRLRARRWARPLSPQCRVGAADVLVRLRVAPRWVSLRQGPLGRPRAVVLPRRVRVSLQAPRVQGPRRTGHRQTVRMGREGRGDP